MPSRSAGCLSQPFAYPDGSRKDDIGRQMLGNSLIEQDLRLRWKFFVTFPVQDRNRDSWCYRKDKGGIGEVEGKPSQLFASAFEGREIVAETPRQGFRRDGMGTAEKSGAARDVLLGNPLPCRRDRLGPKKIVDEEEVEIGVKPFGLVAGRFDLHQVRIDPVVLIPDGDGVEPVCPIVGT